MIPREHIPDEFKHAPLHCFGVIDLENTKNNGLIFIHIAERLTLCKDLFKGQKLYYLRYNENDDFRFCFFNEGVNFKASHSVFQDLKNFESMVLEIVEQAHENEARMYEKERFPFSLTGNEVIDHS